MLPFPIMNHYGNIVPAKARLKSVSTSNVHVALLMSNGNLYTRGTNSFGQLGSGNTTDINDRWYLSLTNVASAYAVSGVTMAVKNDGTVWYCGSNFIQSPFSGNILNWTDITSKFSATSIDPFSIISLKGTNFNILFQTTNNNFYGFGRDLNKLLGTGTTNSYINPVLIASGITKFSASSDIAMYIKDGQLYTCGDNSGVGIGNGGKAKTAYSADSTFSSLQVIDAECYSLESTLVLAKSGNNTLLYSAGNTYGGALGLSDTGKRYYFSNTGYSALTNTIESLSKNYGQGQYISFYFGTDKKYYNAGFSSYQSLGRTGSTATFASASIPGIDDFSTTKIKSICFMNYTNQIMHYDNKLYYCGDNTLFGTTGIQGTLKEVQLPS